jgi:phage gp45-like
VIHLLLLNYILLLFYHIQGHLLVLENNNKIHLNHGLMEVGYIDHQDATFSGEDERNLKSISMTATLDMKGNLVLGNYQVLT